MIERQNIIDLIGKNRFKYSSCIITSYTFDFTFFEERIMSALRIANIKNVNIFLDGNYLENALENPYLNAFLTHKTYSINPIYETGVFHPKIMLLSGPKHGLLLIGSGNLTSSGLSTNDEIWGAFHLNDDESQNAPLFASVWEYLQYYINQSKGFNFQKFAWIKKHSPWLNHIEKLKSNDYILINSAIELKFIGNLNSNSIYNELITSLPNNEILKLTIVSPYFDDEGKVLVNLYNDLNIKELNCITDKEFGLLPIKLNSEISNKIKFYNWHDCIKDFEPKYNRLHAKIFHFQYADNLEYILIGSANATINAVGSKNTKAKNAEAGILIRRISKKSYLSELNIVFANSKTFNLESCKNNNNESKTVSKLKFENRIICSELNGNKLNVYFKEIQLNKATICIIDSENIELERREIELNRRDVKLVIDYPDRAYKVFLMNNDIRISNYCLIHNVALLAKSNPDQKYQDLGQIIESLSNNPENDQIIGLLNYVDYNWADDELDSDGGFKIGHSNYTAKEKVEKKFEELTTNEFNELNSIQVRELNLINNSSIQIADILNLVSKNLIPSSINLLENTEEKLLNLSEEDNDGKVVKQNLSVRCDGENLSNAILKHVEKINKYFESKLVTFHSKRDLKSIPIQPITLKELSNFSIAIDLLYMFYGKKYIQNNLEIAINFDRKYLAKIKDVEDTYKLNRIRNPNHELPNRVLYEVKSSLLSEVMLAFNNISKKLWVDQDEYKLVNHYEEYFNQGTYDVNGCSGLKYFLIDILGCFLLNSNIKAGYKSYDFEPLNEKLCALRETIFEHATFLCLNIHWKESEYKYRDILLLDLIHFVATKNITKESIANIEAKMLSNYEKSEYKNSSFHQNLYCTLHTLLPDYQMSQEFFSKNQNDPLKVVKSSELIYYYVKEIGFFVLKDKGKEFILIEKPGIQWNFDYNSNILKVIYPSDFIKKVNI